MKGRALLEWELLGCRVQKFQEVLRGPKVHKIVVFVRGAGVRGPGLSRSFFQVGGGGDLSWSFCLGDLPRLLRKCILSWSYAFNTLVLCNDYVLITC